MKKIILTCDNCGKTEESPFYQGKDFRFVEIIGIGKDALFCSLECLAQNLFHHTGTKDDPVVLDDLE